MCIFETCYTFRKSFKTEVLMFQLIILKRPIIFFLVVFYNDNSMIWQCRQFQIRNSRLFDFLQLQIKWITLLCVLFCWFWIYLWHAKLIGASLEKLKPHSKYTFIALISTKPIQLLLKKKKINKMNFPTFRTKFNAFDIRFFFKNLHNTIDIKKLPFVAINSAS